MATGQYLQPKSDAFQAAWLLAENSSKRYQSWMLHPQ